MRSLINRIFVSFGIALILGLQVSIHAQVLSKGKIIDTIKCLDHSDQSYSLFLPASYSDKIKWPVIIIFDPGGQGVVAVKAFKPAGEKYGYILACSHNSRNGPLNNNFAAAGFVLNDLSKRYSLNDKRIFTAGFSGGSRFALALASGNEFITGVIGCGAGLPNENNLYPTGRSSFIYYGIAGNRDMNYLEMFDLMTFFNTRTSIVSYLRTFDGGHQWPSPEILQEAVEWINLQTIKKKEIVIDTSFISFLSKKTRSYINNLKSAGNLIDAERYMHYAIRDFSGLQNVSDLNRSITALDQSKEYREASLDWTNIASKERKMNEGYISSIRDVMYSGSISDTTIRWWKNEVGSLKLMKEKSKPANSQMASRLLNFISILCSEQGTAYYRQKKYDLSGFLFEVCTLSDSENKNNYYNLAKSLSGLNRKREAIEALNKAVGYGLTERKTIENEPAFHNLGTEEKYKSLLLRLK
jgi:tetratricopeptide (TPR) repeat protein